MAPFVIHKLGEVWNGRQSWKLAMKINVNILERWSLKPHQENVQECAMAMIVERY